jgi:RNA polymerase sigma-70 factor (ECF subfamily)
VDFETVYNAYFRDVYRYLRGLTSDEALAEELTQETFFKALKALDRYDGAKDIRAWLFTIARNAYYSHGRRQKRLADAEPPETAAPEPGPEERLADAEEAKRIHRCLHAMREPYKEVFTLRVLGELSFEQIGGLFGKSAGWARVVYYRARREIREYLEGSEHE